MKQVQLFFETNKLHEKDNILYWPEKMPEQMYYLIYTHGNLELTQEKKPLSKTKLYEAWAFNGKKSWHIWQRDKEWVCTIFDTTQVDEKYCMKEEQFLSKHFQHESKKTKLIIHHSFNFDEDGQAYIAYSCPIDLE